MMNWKATLVRAAEVSPVASNELSAFVGLLEESLVKAPSAAALEAVAGSREHPRPGFVDAVSAAVQGGRRTEPTLSAARAVLYVLPRLLRSMQIAVKHGASATLPEETRVALKSLVEHEHDVLAKEARAHGARRCPRCGSHQISEHHTDAFDERITELLCRACGQYGSWSDGASDEDQWLTPKDA